MIVCLTGGTPKAGKEEELASIFAEIEASLRVAPGFISSEDLTTERGEDVTVLRFETEAHLASWRDSAPHGSYLDVVQDYYESFWVQVATVYREYRWRDGTRTDGDLSAMFREQT